VILIYQRHRQTDRRTDDMQSQYRALHYILHRAVKSRYININQIIDNDNIALSFITTDNQKHCHSAQHCSLPTCTTEHKEPSLVHKPMAQRSDTRSQGLIR